jgi:hypothetical protein
LVEEGLPLVLEIPCQARQPSLAELMKGARGTVDSGITDLASNPEHLNGHRFRQNWFTHEQWRPEFIAPSDDPGMMLFCPVEERDQGSGINDGATDCGRRRKSPDIECPLAASCQYRRRPGDDLR